MPKPKDMSGVQRFVGMVKYLVKFLPELSNKSEPLRRLTHKDTDRNWGSEQDAASEDVKASVISTPVLKYFDPDCETEGQGDASEKGISFTLMQNGQPVTFPSTALTPAETRYSQIEKELLAQIFGLERNHQFTFGHKITLWTDHKPLANISQKPITSAPKRLQRLLLRLVQYDVEILYKPEKHMYLADTLWRAYLPLGERFIVETETESINMVAFLPVSKPTLQEIQKATSENKYCQSLQELIINARPSSKEHLPPQTHPYFPMRDELSVQHGIICRGLRCVIPEDYIRQSIKAKLHKANTGIEAL
ncbi:hypothetical protein HOLleu_33348 [Holothuria leucospilota]|uniref:Reverse transcriptase/retrotransposon-derived protein RNase H-like domain-containing protein n=1 Tax=Holothuria leucospilota TaxID=206669 RepID=A0A9Q1BFD0_HOLLE|nr:hypothetical protein HOLleu_33348 [Holothuria leucospilota]